MTSKNTNNKKHQSPSARRIACGTGRREFLSLLGKTATVTIAAAAGVMPKITKADVALITGKEVDLGYKYITKPEIAALDNLFKEISLDKATSKSVKAKFEEVINKLNIVTYKSFQSKFHGSSPNQQRFFEFIYDAGSKLSPKDADEISTKAINKLLSSAKSNGRYVGEPTGFIQTRLRELQNTLKKRNQNESTRAAHSLDLYFYDAIAAAWNGHKDNNGWIRALPGGSFDGKFKQVRQNMTRENCGFISEINAIVSNSIACELINKRITRNGDKIEVALTDGVKFFTTKQELDRMTFLAYGDNDTRALEAAVYFASIEGLTVDKVIWGSRAMPTNRVSGVFFNKHFDRFDASQAILNRYKNIKNLIATVGDGIHACRLEMITNSSVVLLEPGIAYDYKYPNKGYRIPIEMSHDSFLQKFKTVRVLSIP